MRRKLSLVLVMLMILSTICVPSVMAADVTAISITQNKCFYLGEDRTAEPLKVIATLADGSESDITGNADIVYQSSDEEVFKFEGDKLSSTGVLGKALITATYDGNTASMVMVRQNSKTYANEPVAPDVNVSNYNNSAYITTGTPGTAEGGHYDGSALSKWPNNWTVRLVRKSWANSDGVPNTKISERWWDSGYRAMAGWFYDDGEASHKHGLEMIYLTDSTLFHRTNNFEDDYGYGEFADKWKGKKSWKVFNNVCLRSDEGNYISGTAFGNQFNGFKKISKGWHQFVISLEKNPDAEYGWSVFTYFDGVFVGSKDVVPEEDDYPAGVPDSNSWAAMEARPTWKAGCQSYLDDMFFLPSLEKEKPPVAPVVKRVTIDGLAMSGSTLTANAKIEDDNGDVLDTPLYQWQASSNGSDWEDINGATTNTFALTDDHIGKYVRISVTPRSTVDPKVGEVYYSQSTDKVIAKITPPSATGVEISGTPDTARNLTASYTYVPSVSNIEEGATKIVWEISTTENGSYSELQSGSSKQYTIKKEDAEKYIRVKVIPTDAKGITGTPVVSAAIKTNKYQEPVASSAYYVSLTGSDDNEGTIDAPFATIEKARDTIASVKLPAGGVTVYLRGGTYDITKTISFNAANSGTAESPIKYEAYNGEKVEFVGGKTLDTSKIKKVTDEALLNRLVDENAKKHLYSLDLGAQGVKASALQSFGWSQPAYNPTLFYMNNTLLTDARWPNDDQSMNLVQAFPITEPGFSASQQPSKLSLIGTNDKGETVDSDPLDRTKKWHIKSGDAYFGGALPFFWANLSLRIDSYDTETKTVTSLDNNVYNLTSGWGVQNKVYFGNIFEEIDVPGESYIDRQNNILYFYPVADVEGSNMVVSTFNKNMVTVNDASYISFKDIAFRDTRATPIVVKNSNHIVLDGNEFSGSSSMAVDMSASEDCEIINSHFYNIANNAIRIKDCGDRKTLKSSNILLENNLFHKCNFIPTSILFAVICDNTVGVKIRHNEFDDLKAAAIRNDASNNTLMEYNKISNSLYFSSDMGAIYWGRDNTVLGTVVRYNYFTDFSTDCWALDEGYVDGVFWDDGASGPELYGNVFYNAGRELSQVRTNGGEVGNVYGNVFINDAETMRYAAYLWGWGSLSYTYKDTDGSMVTLDDKTPARNWLYLYEMRDLMGKTEGSTNRVEGNSNTMKDFKKEYLWSDEWKEAYKGTIWEDTLNLYSKDIYQGAKAFYDAKDEYGLLKFLDKNLPKKINNISHNNMTVGCGKFTDIKYGGENYDNYNQPNPANAKSMFKDYGKDFTLTEEGLKTVQAAAPEFEQIPFDKIGRTTSTWGSKPSVKIKSEAVSGILSVGNEISANYDFIDADGDKEGLSQVYWYVSDKKNSDYSIIPEKVSKTFELTDEYAGRFLKYKVIPYDTSSMRGDTVYSEPVRVRNASSINLSNLNAAMKAAREALEGATVGTAANQYPKAAYDELAAALDEAQALANDPELTQHMANNAATKLETAVAKFEKQKIPAIDMDKIVHMNINPLLADTESWTNPGGKMTFENGAMVLDATNLVLATYNAKKYLNHEISFKAKFEPNDGSSWVGIYFRQAATDKNVWTSGNCGLMYDIKKDIMNVQQHDGGKIAGTDAIIDTVDNNFFSFGEEHTVTLGVYDTDEENKVFWQLKVDGNVVYEKSTEVRELYGKEGYFGFSSSNGKLTVYPTEANKSKLEETIANAEGLNFTAGNGYGEYPSDKIDAFNKAVADAKATSTKTGLTQYDVDKAAQDITDAIDALNDSVNTKETVTGDKTIKINSNYPAAEIKAEKAANDVKLETDKNTALPGMKITAERSIGTVKAEIFDDTKLSGNGTLLAAKELSEPSVSVNNSANVTTIAMAEGSLTSDKAVRIVLPGQAKKNLGIIVDGRFSRVTKKVSADNEKTANSELKAGETAFIKSGNDYIIWTKVLGEFVTYNTSSSDDGNGDIGGGGAGGGTVSNPYGNKGGSDGFFSTDTTNPNLDTEFSFNDIQNHWAKADIMAMYRLGVVSGVTETTFDPDRNITRAEFAALIARALKLAEDAPSKFKDVEAGSWYAASVNACAKAEIITGFDGKFRPNDTITRSEMAVIISNAYTYLGKDVKKGGIDKFSDKAAIAAWAKQAVDMCTTVGLISGMTDTTFEGDKTATRAQATSILKRLLDK